jgi:RNA polymerase sigma factor (sigma-70 family)
MRRHAPSAIIIPRVEESRTGALPGGAATEESALWADLTVENRAALIERYQPLVYHILGQIPHVPSGEHTDVVSEGTLALIEAVDAFDPTRGVKFLTFAYLKVKGRMFDYVRRRKPFVPVEDAGELCAFMRVVGFNEKRPAEDILRNLRLAEEFYHLLTPGEEKVLRMMYEQGMSQDEVSRALDCTRANICILHKRALARLKKIILSDPAWRLAFEP